MKKELIAVTAGMILTLTACGQVAGTAAFTQTAAAIIQKNVQKESNEVGDIVEIEDEMTATSDLSSWTPISEAEYDDALVAKTGNISDLGFKPLSDLAPMDFSKADMSKYATFTEIVDSLKPGMGYANVNLDGTDVLLVSSGCYNWDETSAAIDSSVFMYDNGEVVYLGDVQSGGTANPLSISDGKLLTAGHHYVARNTVQDGKLVVAEEASETFDSEGNATYYYGSEKVEDDTKLMKMFDDFMNAEIVEFQRV